jgi:hypothetical protein
MINNYFITEDRGSQLWSYPGIYLPGLRQKKKKRQYHDFRLQDWYFNHEPPDHES